MIASTERQTSALIMGLDGTTWDRALIASVSVAVVAAVLAGLTAAGSVLSHRREAEAAERTLGRYAEIAAEKIAAAQSEGIIAGRAAENAIGRAERDRLSATNSQLRSDLEKERASRRVNVQNADSVKPPSHHPTPAQLGDEKIAALAKALRGSFGNVSIDYDGGDATTEPVSTQLRSAFRDAGWNISSGIRIGLSAPSKSGILVRANRSGVTASQERAVSALRAANISFDLRLDREPKSYGAGREHAPVGMGMDDLEIVVTAPQR